MEEMKPMSKKKLERYAKSMGKLVSKIAYFTPRNIVAEISWCDGNEQMHTEKVFCPAFTNDEFAHKVYHDLAKYIERCAAHHGVAFLNVSKRNGTYDVIGMGFNDTGDFDDMVSVEDDLAFYTSKRMLSKQNISLFRRDNQYMAIDNNNHIAIGENFTLSLFDVIGLY